jgi:hypothetical protein
MLTCKPLTGLSWLSFSRPRFSSRGPRALSLARPIRVATVGLPTLACVERTRIEDFHPVSFLSFGPNPVGGFALFSRVCGKRRSPASCLHRSGTSSQCSRRQTCPGRPVSAEANKTDEIETGDYSDLQKPTKDYSQKPLSNVAGMSPCTTLYGSPFTTGGKSVPLPSVGSRKRTGKGGHLG